MARMEQLPGRASDVGQVLARLGGDATPGDVGALLDLPHSTQARAIGELRRRCLVDGPKTRLRLTTEGWAAFAAMPDVGAGVVLDEQLAGWPHEHRAFVELLVSAIVARHHLGDEHAEPHLGFMAVGGTGTGKSSIAEFVCRLFGWDLVRHRVFLQQETVGSVGGRRGGGAHEYSRAPLMALPFVVFDEWDNADDPLRRAALPYFQGTCTVQLEGELVALHPVPMLAANPPAGRGRYDHLRGEYRRRSVVLDTGDRRRPELVVFHRQAVLGRPLLPLEQLVPPATELDAQSTGIIDMLHEVLSTEGQDQAPPAQALELAALGRAALLGPGADLRHAAYATVLSYLVVTETIDGGRQVAEGWQLDVRAIQEWLGPGVGGDLEAAMQRARDARAARAADVAVGRRRRVVEDLALTERRAALCAELEQVRRQLHGGRGVPAADQPTAAGIRAHLGKLRESAGAQRSTAGLTEVATLAAAPLARGRELLARLEADKTARTAQCQAEKEQERRAVAARRGTAKADAVARRQQKQALRRELTAVRALASPLERLWDRRTTRRGEAALDTLRRYELPNGQRLVEYSATQPTTPGGLSTIGLLAVIVSAAAGGKQRATPIPTGVWRSPIDEGVTFPGTTSSCPALTEWDEGSRAVIAAALEVIYEREDQLVVVTGTASRSSRRAISTPVHRPQLAALP